MRKYYILLLLIFSFVLFPNKVNGFFCDYSELSRLKNIANNINMSYSYVESVDDVKFSITFVNIRPDIKILDITNNLVYQYGLDITNPSEITLSNYDDGQLYRFKVYTDNTNCNNKDLITLVANLPSYNKFYDDPVCLDIKDYKLCQKWYKQDLNYEQFIQKINEYKVSLIKKPIKEIKTDGNPYANIINFVINYYYYFLITIIAVCLYEIYRLNKKDDFDLNTKQGVKR